MVKTMDAVEHRTLLQMLPGLCRHLQASCDERGAPRSLLTRISGVYSIRMYATYIYVCASTPYACTLALC